MFEKVLRAYTEGDLRYADVQLDLKRLLAGGASPEDLVDVLQRWELIEPLPDDAHDGILRHLNEAIELAAAQSPDPDEATDEELESEPGSASYLTESAGDSEEAPASAGNAHSAEERIARQSLDYAALTRAYEHTRDAASAASARSIALAADLTAARAALELEQSKSREFHKALAERLASDEELRSRSEELERASERHQAELRALRETLAARDKALAQARQSLVERVTDLTAQLEAARVAVESEQGKTQEIQQDAWRRKQR